MIKIFSEAGHKKGYGHFVRMSSLYKEAIKKKRKIEFYLDCTEKSNLFEGINIIFCDWLKENRILDMISAEDIVVIDSYYISLQTLTLVNEKVKKLFIIDDNIRLDYANMNIINPNYFASFLNYPEGKGNIYYVGGEYLFLREAFFCSYDKKNKKNLDNILITFGGSDVCCVTEKVIQEVKKYNSLVELNVVITNSYKNSKEIEASLGPNDNLHRNITDEKMATLMKQADFAISSAGGTSNELLKMCCPSVLLVVADNQILNVKYLEENGLCYLIKKNNLENLNNMFDFEKREYIIQNLKKLRTKKRGVDLVLAE